MPTYNHVMRKVLVYTLSAACLTLLAGCATPHRGVVLPPGSANLALGPQPVTNHIAGQLITRSDWPSTPTGYRFGEVTYYQRSTHDYESGYDRHGGIYYHRGSFRSGVYVR